MSITIHYKGSIRDLALISKLQEEMVDVCEIMNWEYHLLNEDLTKPFDATLTHSEGAAHIDGHIPLKGIIINVDPENESLDLLFTPERNLSSFMLEILKDEGTIDKNHNWIFCKTQYGGVDSHIAIIKLLRHLKQTYIPDMEVKDEGEYWETGDKERLMGKRGFLFGKMVQFEKALSSIEVDDNTSTEELVKKIEDVLRKINNKNK